MHVPSRWLTNVWRHSYKAQKKKHGRILVLFLQDSLVCLCKFARRPLHHNASRLFIWPRIVTSFIIRPWKSRSFPCSICIKIITWNNMLMKKMSAISNYLISSSTVWRASSRGRGNNQNCATETQLYETYYILDHQHILMKQNVFFKNI